MDPRSFDRLARSLAAPRTRRGFLGALAALGTGLLGARNADAQQVTQVSCGNQFCANNPGGCKPGCVCCVYTNPVTGTVTNSRCRPPGTCSPGTETGGATTPAPTTAAPTTTTTAPTTTAPPTTPPPTTTAAPATTTGAPTTTTAAPATTCTTFADCPQPSPGNNCRIRACVRGVCGFGYLPDGTACANPTGDPCVLGASCVSRGPSDLTTCIADRFDPRPACQFPCDTVAECANGAGQCQEMACIFDSHIGTGGCQVVPDPDADGSACTFQCRTCAPDDLRLCIPDGTCQNGTCAAGPRSYTCSPAPTLVCCIGQKDSCGVPRGGDCLGDPSLCCSGECPSGVCA